MIAVVADSTGRWRFNRDRIVTGVAWFIQHTWLRDGRSSRYVLGVFRVLKNARQNRDVNS